MYFDRTMQIVDESKSDAEIIFYNVINKYLKIKN